MTNTQQQFIESFNALASEAHDTAVSKGWWDSEDAELLAIISTDERMPPKYSDAFIEIATKIKGKNDGEMIALMHSELSEALEALRHGNPPSDHIPEFSGAEEEIADTIIRCCDLACARGWRIGEAIIAKMEFNKSRSHRHGGKGF